MGKKAKSLDDCYTRDDFTRYATRHGGEIEYGGRHPKVRGPNGGICPLPDHGGNKAYPPGTRHSIIKMLSAILGILAILYIISSIL